VCIGLAVQARVATGAGSEPCVVFDAVPVGVAA